MNLLSSLRETCDAAQATPSTAGRMACGLLMLSLTAAALVPNMGCRLVHEPNLDTCTSTTLIKEHPGLHVYQRGAVLPNNDVEPIQSCINQLAVTVENQDKRTRLEQSKRATGNGLVTVTQAMEANTCGFYAGGYLIGPKAGRIAAGSAAAELFFAGTYSADPNSFKDEIRECGFAPLR